MFYFNFLLIMLQAIIIGNLGANAQVQDTEKGKFLTMRIAHNDEWTDELGVKHSKTYWVDGIMNCRNGVPRVAEFLVAGQQVYATGSLSTRVYSSQKDRCMKAGLTINIREIQLLGGKADPVPSRLVDKDGVVYPVTKHYWVDGINKTTLTDGKANTFSVDDNGFVKPLTTNDDDSKE